MSQLITELLDVANSALGHAVWMQLEPVDLVALIRRIAKDQEEIAGDRRVRVHSSVPTLIGVVDPDRLARAFANLISNALKYGAAHEDVSITIEPQEMGDESWAQITITDVGPGIPQSDLPYIFDRFRRGSNVLGRTSGMGIGLTVVRDIVERHGGQVRVESEEGKGSSFEVILPMDKPTPQ